MSDHLGDRFVSAPSPDHLTRTLTSRRHRYRLPPAREWPRRRAVAWRVRCFRAHSAVPGAATGRSGTGGGPAVLGVGKDGILEARQEVMEGRSTRGTEAQDLYGIQSRMCCCLGCPVSCCGCRKGRHDMRTVLLVFYGWVIAWVSNTIARAVYPSPRARQARSQHLEG
jgi:hypothetical protein